PRNGRNVASVVLNMPLHLIAHSNHPTILVWATAQAPGETGQIADRAGRALRSMFPESQEVNNYINPASDFTLGLVPDVVIFDTPRPAAYPNGRALADDVVHYVCDRRLLANNGPGGSADACPASAGPTTNDLPFLSTFPYLAPPHGAPDTGYFIN